MDSTTNHIAHLLLLSPPYRILQRHGEGSLANTAWVEKTQKLTVHQLILTLGANRGLQISASATQSTKDLL